MLPVWPRRFSEPLAYSGRFQRGDPRPGHYAGIRCFSQFKYRREVHTYLCHSSSMRVLPDTRYSIADLPQLLLFKQAGVEQQSTKAAAKVPPALKTVSPVSSSSGEAKDLVAKAKREADEILKQAQSAGASLLEVGWCAHDCDLRLPWYLQ